MVCGLDESHPGSATIGDPLQCTLHELASNHAVLSSGIHGDRSYTSDRGALVQDVASNDSIAQFRDDDMVSGMGQPVREASYRDVRRGKVRREAMFVGNGLEGFIADGPTLLGIVRSAGTEC
jgi:hypothetical protein